MNVADPPKSILKKKSQFDRETDSYFRVKPVKSIRFSLDSNKISSKSSPAASNISLDPKIIKNKKDQNKKEKKRRRRNDSHRNVGEETEPFPTENIDKSRKPKKSFLEGHGDEKGKNNYEKNEEETIPDGNKGDSLIIRLIEEVKKNKEEETKEAKEAIEEKPKAEKEAQKKVKKKRRRRRRRKQKREIEEMI